MTQSGSESPPQRGPRHEALEVFVGDWRAEGESFGGPRQSRDDPRADATPWVSTHTARWHTGKFFLVQEERANPGVAPFDTLSVMGWDELTQEYFARTFENHGFYRCYEVSVEGRVWTFGGATERCRIVFSDDGRTQTIAWEWKPGDAWLPLCDRVATRT